MSQDHLNVYLAAFEAQLVNYWDLVRVNYCMCCYCDCHFWDFGTTLKVSVDMTVVGEVGYWGGFERVIHRVALGGVRRGFRKVEGTVLALESFMMADTIFLQLLL